MVTLNLWSRHLQLSFRASDCLFSYDGPVVQILEDVGDKIIPIEAGHVPTTLDEFIPLVRNNIVDLLLKRTEVGLYFLESFEELFLIRTWLFTCFNPHLLYHRIEIPLGLVPHRLELARIVETGAFSNGFFINDFCISDRETTLISILLRLPTRVEAVHLRNGSVNWLTLDLIEHTK